MKLFRQTLILLSICFAGEFLNKLLKIPVPGGVIGMLLLFLCLCTGVVKLKDIEEISRFLLDHLTFFFIPAGVSLLVYLDIFSRNWVEILGICLTVTVLVMVVTGHTVQWIRRGMKK